MQVRGKAHRQQNRSTGKYVFSGRSNMAEYGKTLKQLIDFSSVKMYLVAEAVGYDVSYISKWCNKGYLPSAKASPKINSTLAQLLSDDIALHCDLDEFNLCFSTNATRDTLESVIRNMLQDAYASSARKDSRDNSSKENTTITDQTIKALIHTDEVRRFFREDMPECLYKAASASDKPLEILCTLDLCLFLGKTLPHITFPEDREFHVKIAVNESRLYADSGALLQKLYMFLSIHNKVSFDLYSDEKLSKANVILVQDHLAAICSLDSDGRAMSIFRTSSPEMVRHMYHKLASLFNHSRVLLQVSDAIDFHRKGYRTDFYSRNNFQILLACGFEYLLPKECWQSVEDTARKKYKNEHIALLVRRLQVIWEEIFEHGSIDFFVLKTAILRYIETGEIIFTDIVHRLTPEERKLHLQNVLEVARKNPNIVFYLIDDEKFPEKNQLAYLSVFNNRQTAFLKNPNRYRCDYGPFFYSVRDNLMISKMTEFFDNLRKTPACSRYGYKELQAFYDNYASMINRMIDL